MNPVRMFDGMDEEVVPKKQVELTDGPLLSERDRLKIERKKRKDERQREVTFICISYLISMIMHFCLCSIISMIFCFM